MKTLVAVAILAMVLVPPALAKAKRAQSARAQSAPQQGYQSSERPGYYHGYPLSEWYRDLHTHAREDMALVSAVFRCVLSVPGTTKVSL